MVAMETASTYGSGCDCCVVLMMKSATRSKRRLAEHIGARRATEVAQQLLACVREDFDAWPGAKCVAPSAADERVDAPPADAVVLQCDGNLGARIEHVNRALIELGFERQLFIGIDCPSLDVGYLSRAAAALGDHDAVLGPAADGGVVLMGVRGRWPRLTELPWSTSGLLKALQAAFAARGASVAMLPQLRDVDTLDDLVELRTALVGDSRPARCALAHWLTAQGDLER
jgi:glycosyltransferase A (GT-A) superfamily protein (DUF2064 family)